MPGFSTQLNTYILPALYVLENTTEGSFKISFHFSVHPCQCGLSCHHGNRQTASVLEGTGQIERDRDGFYCQDNKTTTAIINGAQTGTPAK